MTVRIQSYYVENIPSGSAAFGLDPNKRSIGMVRKGTLSRFGFLAMTSALLVGFFSMACDTTSPKARAKKMVSIMNEKQAKVAIEMEKAGLHPPPRAVDLLTGGDWGAGIDLGQAVNTGFPESCQLIWEHSLASLMGMISYYSTCLDEPSPYFFPAGAESLAPPWATKKDAEALRPTLTLQATKAMRGARSTFYEAYVQISALGPFMPGRGVRRVTTPAPAIPKGPDPTPMAHGATVEGIGKVWSFNTVGLAHQVAAGPDESFWVAMQGQDRKTIVYHFRNGDRVSEFRTEGANEIRLCSANAAGLVAFEKMASTEPGLARLVQYDQEGKVLWQKAFQIDLDNENVTAYLTTLAQGETYAALCEKYLENNRYWFRSQLFGFNKDGASHPIPLAAPKVGVQWLGNDGSSALVVINHILNRITPRGLSPLADVGFPGGPEGDRFLFGDDGSFYREDPGYQAVRLGKNGAILEQRNIKWGNGFHVGADGAIFRLVGRSGVTKFYSSPKQVVTPFSPELPEASRLRRLKKGMFLLDYYEKERPGLFAVVELNPS